MHKNILILSFSIAYILSVPEKDTKILWGEMERIEERKRSGSEWEEKRVECIEKRRGSSKERFLVRKNAQMKDYSCYRPSLIPPD